MASAKIEDRSEEMAKGTFGERLKRERELREVTSDEICSATRIAPKFLEALENEQWEKLPGGVFGRGFVRTIARYLGLSEENLLSEYDLARGEANSPALPKPEERIPSTPKWVPAAALLMFIALVLGLIFGGRYAWRLYVAHRAAKKVSAAMGFSAASDRQNGRTEVPANSRVDASEKLVALNLTVTASAATGVRVLADQAAVYDAVIPAGQTLQFRANDNFAVTAENGSALLLQLNGRGVALPGTPGSSATISLTSKDLRPTAGGPTHP